MTYKTKGAELSAKRCKARAKTFEERLLVKENGCIEWQGSRDKDGYGTMRRDSKDWKTHRYAFFKAHGEIPKGYLVCHSCDNPSCCNIDHLFLGTQKENVEDMVRKKRQLIGEKNPHSKLTEHLVKHIKKRLADGDTQTKIAKDLNMNQTTISKIKLGISWSHVE